MTNRSRTIAAAITVAMAAIAGGCTSQQRVSQGTSVEATAAPTPTDDTPTTDSAATPADTAPADTAPLDTAPTDTTPLDTTPPPDWSVVDPDAFAAPLAFPCCASNWVGVPSPPFPAAGEPLADGVYAIDFSFPTAATDPIVATVLRFEACGALPANSCEDNNNGAYAPDEIGIDPTATYAWTFVLDDGVRVVLGGFAGWADSPESSTNFRTTTGTHLAELVAAVDADFTAAITNPVADGIPLEQVVATLALAPANGFGSPGADNAGALAYTFAGAPPLLFQGIDPTSRGSDVIGRISLQVQGGTPTLFLYAGFYS